MTGSGLPTWYQKALEERARRLVDSGVIQHHGDDGRHYFTRPSEVLVAGAHMDALQRELKSLDARPIGIDVGLRIARHRVESVDVPTAVARLREAAGDVRAAAPHHVLFGTPYYHGSPGGPPVPVPGKSAVDLASTSEGAGIRIGVVDTGIAESAWQLSWMREHVTVGGPTDTDVLDSDGDGYLDLEAGHGTFIAGLLQQVAGGADVVMRAGISPTGITDEFTVAGAVRELLDLCGVQIVNLSLGGYVHDDEVGLLGWDALLDREDCVFVAAAGNHGSDRPFFPAADPRVIAVAALGTNGSRAAWSNYGAWVQACVPGEHLLSAYVQGRDEFDADGDGSPDEFAGPDPCALWSGTSFAAPQVAGLIAAESARTGSSVRDAAQVVLGSGKSVTGLGRKLSSPLHGRRLVAATP